MIRVTIPSAPKNMYILDNIEFELYSKIRNGERVTSGGSKKAVNALGRLRRNGLIDNQGSRSSPHWVISDRWKKYNLQIVID